MPSPACTINALTPPQDVAASSTVTLALANASGVVFWGLTCIGTDETTTAAAVNATLAVNSSAKTATFTAGGLGTATIWQSTVGVGSKSQQGAGCDANNAVQPSYTTTFKVNVKAANGNRVLVVNEVNEQDSTFGWINEVNAALRGEQTSTITLLGDVTGNTSASVVSGISGVSPIAITPASLSWAIGTASPQITQSTQVSNAAPQNLTFAPQAPNAGASNASNGTGGSLVIPLATPVNGGSEAVVQITRGGSPVFALATYAGSAPLFGIFFGTTAAAIPTVSSAFSIAGDGGTTYINGPSAGLGVHVRAADLDVATFTSTLASFAHPLGGLGASVPLQLAATASPISTASSSVSLSSAQIQTPVIQLNGTINASNCTITLPNTVGAIWYFDLTGVTFGGHSIVFTTGSGTSATVSSIGLSGQFLLTVIVVASNVVSCGGA